MANYESTYTGQQVDDAIAKSQAIPSAAAINTSVTKTQQIPTALQITAGVTKANMIPSLGTAGQVLAVDENELGLEYKTMIAPSSYGAANQYLKMNALGDGLTWGAGTSGTTLYSHNISFDATDPDSNTWPVRFTILTANSNVYDTAAHFVDDLFACATSDTSGYDYRVFPVNGVGPVENSVGGTYYMGLYFDMTLDKDGNMRFGGTIHDPITLAGIDYNLNDSSSFTINPLNMSNFSDIRTIYYTGYNP